MTTAPQGIPEEERADREKNFIRFLSKLWREPSQFCQFRTATCCHCVKKGHIAWVCHSYMQAINYPKSRRTSFKPYAIREDCFAISHDHRVTEVAVRHSNAGASNKLFFTVKIEGVECQMEIDMGSSKSIVSWSTLQKLVSSIQKSQLSACHLKRRDYQENYFPIIRHGQFLVENKKFTSCLPLIVVNGTLPSLLGLDWFYSLGLGITRHSLNLV